MILPDYDHHSPCPNCEDIAEARRVAAAKMAAVRARGPVAPRRVFDATTTTFVVYLSFFALVVAIVIVVFVR